MRSVPLRLEPAEGESLPGYLFRYAFTFNIPPGDVGDAFGYWPLQPKIMSAAPGVALSEQQLSNLTSSTRLSEQTLKAMTLERYDGGMFHLNLKQSLSKGRASVLMGRRVSVRKSEFCPECLAENGIWQLKWQSRWFVICTEHRSRLRMMCPECDTEPSVARKSVWPLDGAGLLTDPKFCWSGGRKHVCRQDLSKVDPGSGKLGQSLVDAQLRIEQIVEQLVQPTLGGEGVDPVEFLSDLSGLIDLAQIQRRSNNDRAFYSSASSGSTNAIAQRDAWAEDLINYLPDALRLADLPDREALVQAVRSIGDEGYLDRKEFLPQNRRYPACSSVFKDALNHARETTVYANVGARYGFDSRRHRRPADLNDSLGIEHIPQMFWRNEFDQSVSALFEDLDFTHWRARRFCSVMLVRMLAPMSWKEAGEYLGLPDVEYSHAALTAAMAEFTKRGREGELLATLKGVANEKASSGNLVDFRVLELDLRAWSGVDHATWIHLFPGSKPNGRRRDSARKRAYLSALIWSEIAETDEQLWSGWPGGTRFEFTEFRRKILPPVSLRTEMLKEIIRANPSGSHNLHLGLLIGQLVHSGEITPRVKRLELDPELIHRTINHVSAHTGVDPHSLLEPISHNNRPPAATHARLMVGAILYRLGGSFWDKIANLLSGTPNRLSVCNSFFLENLKATPRFVKALEETTDKVADGRVPVPEPAGPELHIDRMHQLGEEIRFMALETLPTDLPMLARRQLSIRAAISNTDLDHAEIWGMHGLKNFPTVDSERHLERIIQEGRFTESIKEFASRARGLRESKGYANAYLVAGLMNDPRGRTKVRDRNRWTDIS